MRMWTEGACYCGDKKRNMAREEGDGGQYPAFTDSIAASKAGVGRDSGLVGRST